MNTLTILFQLVALYQILVYGFLVQWNHCFNANGTYCNARKNDNESIKSILETGQIK
jgi:hypothetical protein